MSGFDRFAQGMERLNRQMKIEMPLIIEAAGAELLAETRKEIVRQQLVDTRDMLNSFSLGNSFNVFEKRKNGLEVEVGTTSPYAKFVNEGHWTFGRKSFVEPTHFFDMALALTGEYMKQAVQNKFDVVIRRSLGG